jgi:hypothetical protein
MLIKLRDKTSEIDELSALAHRTDLEETTRFWIERELRTARRGLRGERDAEYEIEFHFGRRPDVATLHGIRLDHDGRTAQIDHVLISRYLDIWVCESKAITGRVEVNDHGEWQVVYRNKTYGMKSPIFQAWNHLNVVADVVRSRAVSLPEVGNRPLTPSFKIAVLFSNRTRIMRPVTGAEHLDAELKPVMKVERFYATVQSVLRTHAAHDDPALSPADLVEFAGKIAARHAPPSTDWPAKFQIPAAPSNSGAGYSSDNVVEIEKSLCQKCRVHLRPGEVRYCIDRKSEFDGRLYCFRCQAGARNLERQSG